jgi:flagellin
MSVINTNLSAVAAQNSLRTSALNQTTAMERLSSGIRINSAKDDAAGLAISTRMTANIRGLSAAIRNANDGISLTQTAEGGLSSISDNLQRIRELAVQSANTGNNESDRSALNTEARQLVSEIDRVANNAQFNGIRLLDGSFQNQTLQVGAGNDANDRIAISIGSAKVSALGIGSNSSFSKTLDTGTAVNTSKLLEGQLSINGAKIGASESDGVSFAFADGSAISKAGAINAASGLTGVTAKVNATVQGYTIAATSFKGTAEGDVLINGVDIGPIEQSGLDLPSTTSVANRETANAIARGTQVAAAINAKTSQTGVTAIANTTNGRLSLTAADGRNITVTTTNNGAAETGLAASTSHTKSGTATTVGTPATSLAALADADTTNFIKINDITINSTAIITATLGTTTTTLVTQVADAVTHSAKIILAINAKSAQTGVTAVAGAAGRIDLTANNGKAVKVELGGTAVGDSGLLAAVVATTVPTTAAAATTTSTITMSTNGDRGIVVGGSTGSTATGQKVGFNASVLSSSGGVDLSTAAGSIAALTVLDKAINTVTDSRASMGAYQNRLTASIANLEVTSMNLQASRSRILDTDYAKETTNLAKSQIIQQAATAMLAQANQSAQSVLSLLK